MENNVKLTIKITHTDPINLYDLTIGLNSLAKIYSRFNNNDKEAKLFVREIRQSSIEIDLISSVFQSAVPLICDANHIIQFCSYLKSIILTLMKSEKSLPIPTMADCKDFLNTTKIISNPNDSFKVEARSIIDSTIYIGCEFNGIDIKKMTDFINSNLDENNSIKQKQLFCWVQANFRQTNTGNRGVIENISKEPLRIIFNDDKTKNEMTFSEDKIEWQNKYFIVDVETQFSQGKPKLYKILKNYPEESFPIKENSQTILAYS